MTEPDPAYLKRDFVALERELHRQRVENRRLTEELEQSERRAATWRRVAQWIHEANQAPEET